MKKSVIIALSCFIFGVFQAQIDFKKESFDDIKALAKREKKNIFIDAYAEWCAPCKMMVKQVFSDQEVGAVFNKNFINVKIDMEKAEGIDLAKSYKIYAYPTLLFIDAQGKEVHRYVGGMNTNDFLDLGKKVADPNFTPQLTLEQRYEKGERGLAFLGQYLMELRGTNPMKAIETASEYIALKKDKNYSREEMMMFFMGVDDLNAESFKKYIADEKEISTTIGKAQYQELKTAMVLKTAFKNATNPDRSLNEAKFREMTKDYLSQEFIDQHLLTYKIKLAQAAGDYGTYEKLALEKYKSTHHLSAEELNSVAWLFFQKIENKTSLLRAIDWAKTALDIDTNYFYLNTLASLYLKVGDFANAKLTAQRALDVAHATHQDDDMAKQILEKL